MTKTVIENIQINEALKNLYKEGTQEFLSLWGSHFEETDLPCKINEFGIIDPEQFDAKKRILIIGKETNGWSNADYETGETFLEWMRKITQKETNCLEGQTGRIKKNPNMWYTIGRWIMAIGQGFDDESILGAKDRAFHHIGTIAFTNINKVRGNSSSGKSYRKLANEPFVADMIIREIELIKPNRIILCDEIFADTLLKTYANSKYSELTALKKVIFSNKLFIMPHPAARISKEDFLQLMQSKIKKNDSYKLTYLHYRLMEETVSRLWVSKAITKKEDWNHRPGGFKITSESGKSIRINDFFSKLSGKGCVLIDFKHPAETRAVTYTLTEKSEIDKIAKDIVKCILEE